MFGIGVAVCVSACGGGGGQDLTVAFSYGGAGAPLFVPFASTPYIQGLNGNVPRCSVSSGTLPPGITLGSNCALGGTPTVVGKYSATITLTADRYDGSVSAVAPIDVLAPVLNPIGTPTASDGQTLSIGLPLSRLQIVRIGTPDTAGHPTYDIQPADTARFDIVSGVPPPGLTLDAASGTLSGTPTGFGVTMMSIALTVIHGGASYTTPPVSVQTRTVEAPWTFRYAGCCSGNEGDNIAFVPTTTFQPVADATSKFTWRGVPPAGVTLDATTGALGGWLGTRGETVAAVTQTLTLPDGSVQTATSADIVWQATGPIFNYSAFTAYTFAGQSFSYAPGPISNSLAGDVNVFSMVPTAGSGAVLPAWLHIEPSTGALYGVGATPAAISDGADVTVLLTTTRNGHSFSNSTRITFSMQP